MEDLIHAPKLTSNRIGKGNVCQLLVREKLNRKENLLTEEKKSKPKKFKTYPPEYLHIDMKYLPKVDKVRYFLFVAIGRNARLVIITMYPGSGIKEAVKFLQHCIHFSNSLYPTYLPIMERASPIGFERDTKHLLENISLTKPARNIPLSIGSHLLSIPKPTGCWNGSIAGSIKSSNLSVSRTGNP